jgi:UPF0042 nucleotide-binding protein
MQKRHSRLHLRPISRRARRRSSPPRAPQQALSSQSSSGRGTRPSATELVVVTGMSGSGKGSVLKVFEDMGYYCVDNLPVDLIPKFAELCRNSSEISRAALVVDIREGEALQRLPALYHQLKNEMPTLLVFLHASDKVLLRRFSETRRPHPLGGDLSLRQGIAAERERLRPIRNLADLVVDTSRFNVHELRNYISDHFKHTAEQRPMLISCVSFGYRHGVPADSDLVFDVRFLPNPNYIPEFHHLSGKHPKVAKYIRSFPQTQEFNSHISELLAYLIPHYMREGKSYLTIAFGCTGGRHRSVMIAETIGRNLSKKGFRTKIVHRDLAK